VPEPAADHARRVVAYYHKPESRLSYRLLLGGTKHYGFYPAGSRRLSMARAMRLMEDKLGVTLDLPPGSRVLDAGCGQGDVAVRLATRFDLEVDGGPQMTSAQRQLFDFVVELSAMRSLPAFVHDGFPALLDRAGFEPIAVEDISERVGPMVRRLARTCFVPAHLARVLGARGVLLNCTAAVESHRHREAWRYNVVTARRPR
jgi:hypothetical protein